MPPEMAVQQVQTIASVVLALLSEPFCHTFSNPEKVNDKFESGTCSKMEKVSFGIIWSFEIWGFQKKKFVKQWAILF